MDPLKFGELTKLNILQSKNKLDVYHLPLFLVSSVEQKLQYTFHVHASCVS